MSNANKLDLLLNPENRFVYDNKRKMIHDRDCTLVKEIRNNQLDVFRELSPLIVQEKRLCPICKRKLAVRYGMKDDARKNSRYFDFYMEFFNKIDASNDDLVWLFIREGGSVEYVSRSCVQIHVREDTWRINYTGSELNLLHNNYTVNEEGERRFTEGFHVQDTRGKNAFHYYVFAMCKYRYEFHRQEYEKYQENVRRMRFQAAIAVSENYVRLEKKSLLFDYYCFVDINEDADDCDQVRSLCSMKILKRSVQKGLHVNTCRVPKWKRKWFHEMMKSLKERAYNSYLFDYLEVCEEFIPQVA